jgi:hypothetical protein
MPWAKNGTPADSDDKEKNNYFLFLLYGIEIHLLQR